MQASSASSFVGPARRLGAALLLSLLLPWQLAAGASDAAPSTWTAALMEAEADPHRAVENAQSALDSAAPESGAALQALQSLTVGYTYLDELNRHPELVERGELLARARGQAEAASWFGELRARALAEQGQQLQALSAFDQLVANAEQAQLQRLPWLWVAQADALANVGRRTEALAIYSRAYEQLEARSERLGMAAALMGIAGAHAEGSDATSQALAQEYMTRALGLIDPATHRRMNVVMNVRLGVTMQRRQLSQQARAQLNLALALAEQMRLPYWLAQSHYFLAKLDLQEGRYADGLRELDIALPVFRGERDKSFHVAASAIRAQMLAALSRKAESHQALTEGERVLPEAHNPRLEAFFRDAAVKTYDRLGEDRQAYEQLLALREVERNVAAEANARQAEEIKVKFGVELQQRENALLRAEQQEAQTRRYALLAGLVLSIAALGTLVLLLRKRAAMASADAAHQAALARAQAEANRAKSVFLASMSHELRTPLNGVLGYAQLLQMNDKVSAETKAGLQVIEKSGRHLLTLIDDVLDLARIEAGRLELSLAPVDLAALLRGVNDLMQVRAREKQLGFEVQGADLPAVVATDETRLRQVLLNLLGNALKFTDKGTVALRVSARPAVKPGWVVLRFEVQDSGVGIAVADLPGLFQPFRQVGEHSRRAAGTGLGLSISQQIVQAMGGTITAASTPGEGSVFSFEIEVQPTAAATEPPAPTHTVAGYEGPRKQVLVVDDVAANRALVADILRPLGFTVHEARDAEEGLAAAQSIRPDMVLIDNAMPGLNGLEATRRLRRIPGLERVPVLAVSASASAQDRAEALAAGANDFLPKPVELERFLSLLETHLDIRFVHRRATPSVPPEVAP